MELFFAPFNIGGCITKIFSALSGSVITGNLVVEKNIAADVPPLLVGDVYRVEHVISNLLSNAIKFSPDAGVIRVNVSATAMTPTVTLDSEALPSVLVTVSISDEGPGISEENQSKLFDGFFQVRPDQLQQGKGSGLGLALCKQIVSLHGGTIGMDSAEGHGSTFHFCIPFSVPPTRCDEPEEAMLLALPALEATTTLHSSIHMNNSVVSCGTDVSPTVLVVDGKSKPMHHSLYYAKECC